VVALLVHGGDDTHALAAMAGAGLARSDCSAFDARVLHGAQAFDLRRHDGNLLLRFAVVRLGGG
jgi:hypothetical protein